MKDWKSVFQRITKNGSPRNQNEESKNDYHQLRSSNDSIKRNKLVYK